MSLWLPAQHSSILMSCCLAFNTTLAVFLLAPSLPASPHFSVLFFFFQKHLSHILPWWGGIAPLIQHLLPCKCAHTNTCVWTFETPTRVALGQSFHNDGFWLLEQERSKSVYHKFWLQINLKMLHVFLIYSFQCLSLFLSLSHVL